MPPSLEGLVSEVLRQPLSILQPQEVLAARTLIPASVETKLWAEVAGLEYGQLEVVRSELEETPDAPSSDTPAMLYHAL